MAKAFQRELIERLNELVRCSDAMNHILKEQEAALKTEDPHSLLRAINDMDECRCQLLDLDKAISDLKTSAEKYEEAMEIPQVRDLVAQADLLLEENTNLMLSNRELIDTKIGDAPEDIKELLRERALDSLLTDERPPRESVPSPLDS